jgi:hypothetical protein
MRQWSNAVIVASRMVGRVAESNTLVQRLIRRHFATGAHASPGPAGIAAADTVNTTCTRARRVQGRPSAIDHHSTRHTLLARPHINSLQNTRQRVKPLQSSIHPDATNITPWTSQPASAEGHPRLHLRAHHGSHKDARRSHRQPKPASGAIIPTRCPHNRLLATNYAPAQNKRVLSYWARQTQTQTDNKD